MTASELLAELEGRGVEFYAEGDRLRFRPAEVVSGPLLDALREHKAGVIELLNRRRYDEDARVMLGFALDAICRDYPLDRVTETTWPLRWCQSAAPNLYNRIAAWIPEQISRAMEEHRPLPDLRELLDDWVGLHSEMYAMFRAIRRR